MDKWEFLRITVYHKADGHIDFVARRGIAMPSIATHDGMEGHFNVEKEKWNAYLQGLINEGWGLEKVDKHDDANETHYFKRQRD